MPRKLPLANMALGGHPLNAPAKTGARHNLLTFHCQRQHGHQNDALTSDFAAQEVLLSIQIIIRCAMRTIEITRHVLLYTMKIKRFHAQERASKKWHSIISRNVPLAGRNVTGLLHADSVGSEVLFPSTEPRPSDPKEGDLSPWPWITP